jgi:hypothetical protein
MVGAMHHDHRDAVALGRNLELHIHLAGPDRARDRSGAAHVGEFRSLIGAADKETPFVREHERAAQRACGSARHEGSDRDQRSAGVAQD